jgi:hypothetical protein
MGKARAVYIPRMYSRLSRLIMYLQRRRIVVCDECGHEAVHAKSQTDVSCEVCCALRRIAAYNR